MVGDMSAGLANVINWVLSRYYTPDIQAKMAQVRLHTRLYRMA
jgi:hypothetical protein